MVEASFGEFFLSGVIVGKKESKKEELTSILMEGTVIILIPDAFTPPRFMVLFSISKSAS